jgi:hypothetical protein
MGQTVDGYRRSARPTMTYRGTVQSGLTTYGFTGYIPTTILFDMDGNARMQWID